jgi:hypothetical protein
MVAGVITRDSVRNALIKGITADQVKRPTGKLITYSTCFIVDHILLAITCPSSDAKKSKSPLVDGSPLID